MMWCLRSLMSTLFSTITSYTSGLAFISAGETAEQYIRVLYELEDHCEFGGKRDKQFRDCLVVGKFARQRKLTRTSMSSPAGQRLWQ